MTDRNETVLPQGTILRREAFLSAIGLVAQISTEPIEERAAGFISFLASKGYGFTLIDKMGKSEEVTIQAFREDEPWVGVDGKKFNVPDKVAKEVLYLRGSVDTLRSVIRSAHREKIGRECRCT